MNNVINRALAAKKKNYNIPQTEVSVVKAMSLMTVSGNFSTGGGEIPEQGI